MVGEGLVVGPHFGFGQSRPPHPHNAAWESLPPNHPQLASSPQQTALDPIANLGTRHHHSDHSCNNKINNTSPSLGRKPPLALKPSRPTPHSYSHNAASPCSKLTPSDASIVADTATHLDFRPRRQHQLRHLHLRLHLRRPAFPSTSHHVLTLLGILTAPKRPSPTTTTLLLLRS